MPLGIVDRTSALQNQTSTPATVTFCGPPPLTPSRASVASSRFSRSSLLTPWSTVSRPGVVTSASATTGAATVLGASSRFCSASRRCFSRSFIKSLKFDIAG